MLDVKQLRVLKAVAEHGSFSAAAEALSYTQPAISQQVAALEKQAGTTLVDRTRHTVIESPHPSPLSAHNGFFGSKPFSRANEALVAAGRTPVDWCLPPLG